jgi:hypothetical protein
MPGLSPGAFAAVSTQQVGKPGYLAHLIERIEERIASSEEVSLPSADQAHLRKLILRRLEEGRARVSRYIESRTWWSREDSRAARLPLEEEREARLHRAVVARIQLEAVTRASDPLDLLERHLVANNALAHSSLVGAARVVGQALPELEDYDAIVTNEAEEAGVSDRIDEEAMRLWS